MNSKFTRQNNMPQIWRHEKLSDLFLFCAQVTWQIYSEFILNFNRWTNNIMLSEEQKLVFWIRIINNGTI